MLLYKYMGVDAARAIIEGNKLGLRQPYYFNDPFELRGVPSTPQDPLMPEIVMDFRDLVKYAAWSKGTAILALTRDPLNPLMWAHYANEHRGVVLGFDVSSEAFTSEELNLIPIQHGSVIYTGTRPRSQYAKPERLVVGGEHRYRPELHEFLQRQFLYKPAVWAYEEEVRLVRSLGAEEKLESLDDIGGAPLHLLELPPDSLRELYVGVRTEHVHAQEFHILLDGRDPAVKLYSCEVGTQSWNLERSELGPF